MKLTLTSTWFILITLVVIMSLVNVFFEKAPYFWNIILLLSAVKFLLVGFQFLEIKKANVFWKILISLFIVIFSLLLIFFRK